MRLTGLNDFKRRGCCSHSDGSPTLSVGKNVIVFACARACFPECCHIIKCRAFLQRPPHKCGHRNAVPLSFALPPHLTQRDSTGIHSTHTANESSIAHVDKGNKSFRRDHKTCCSILKTDHGHVVQNATVVQRSTFCSRAKESKSRTVKEFWKHVDDLNKRGIEIESFGQRPSLLFVTLGNMRREP